jgi:hypothetical protein
MVYVPGKKNPVTGHWFMVYVPGKKNPVTGHWFMCQARKNILFFSLSV